MKLAGCVDALSRRPDARSASESLNRTLPAVEAAAPAAPAAPEPDDVDEPVFDCTTGTNVWSPGFRLESRRTSTRTSASDTTPPPTAINMRVEALKPSG